MMEVDPAPITPDTTPTKEGTPSTAPDGATGTAVAVPGPGGVEAVLSNCLERFASPDFIMEPEIFTQLKTYFQAGGNPETVIDLLSKSYIAVAQMANLMAEWLILAGEEITNVQQQVERHLYDVILKTFDPKKADAIFADEGETPSWLAEMIEYPTWRSLIYRLAEDYPDCLMLNFTIKLISDAGFQGEITSISTAAQQIEVFSRILKTSVTNFLNSPEDQLQKNMEDCSKMVCHGQHTYVYAQVLLSVLAHEKSGHVIRRLQEEIHREAQSSEHDVTPITMSLLAGFQHTRAAQALSSMLSRHTLNPADIVVLYKLYHQSSEPPPVELIRIPAFLEMLIDALFKPNSRINQEHKYKYIFLLAYAASVCDTWNYKRGTRKHLNKDELKGTTQAAEKVHSILSLCKGSTELIAELNTLYQCIRFPVVSVGIIRWVECVVSEPNFFSLSTDYCRPVQLALLDEVVTCHPLLHQKVLQLYISLFEKHYESLEILAHLEIKKMLLDRLVNLLSRGYVLPVVKYIKKCWEQTDTDVSLIRYFVTEVLDTIAPPYSPEFVNLFLPLVENEEIVGGVRREGDEDPVSEFVVHCRANYALA